MTDTLLAENAKRKSPTQLKNSSAYKHFGSVYIAELGSVIHGMSCSDGVVLEKDLLELVAKEDQLEATTIAEALTVFNEKKLDFAVARQLKYLDERKSTAADIVIFERRNDFPGSPPRIYLTLVELKAGVGPFDWKKVDGEFTNLFKIKETIEKDFPELKVEVKLASWYCKEEKPREEELFTMFTLGQGKGKAYYSDVWTAVDLVEAMKIESVAKVEAFQQKKYSPEANRMFAYEQIVKAAEENIELDDLLLILMERKEIEKRKERKELFTFD